MGFFMINKNFLWVFFCVASLGSINLVKAESTYSRQEREYQLLLLKPEFAHFKKQLLIDKEWAERHNINIDDHLKKMFKDAAENANWVKARIVHEVFNKTQEKYYSLGDMINVVYGDKEEKHENEQEKSKKSDDGIIKYVNGYAMLEKDGNQYFVVNN